jgi:uncharacterized membrane protein YkvA (DUF1232 family)
VTFLTRLKRNAKKLQSEIQAVYFASRHPGVGLLPKIILIITVGYLVSPIDLIPDFIPILGYLDDLVIIPFLISLAIKLIPEDIMAECREKAGNEPFLLRKKRTYD